MQVDEEGRRGTFMVVLEVCAFVRERKVVRMERVGRECMVEARTFGSESVGGATHFSNVKDLR